MLDWPCLLIFSAFILEKLIHPFKKILMKEIRCNLHLKKAILPQSMGTSANSTKIEIIVVNSFSYKIVSKLYIKSK